jgi:type I restriction enzyme M protein
MLNQETKRHIDNARQILVGVVPNPSSQIDQITNALIYKFMDDMDESSINAGGDAVFFVGDLEKYSWGKLMDSKVTNQERLNLYSEALTKFSQSAQLPELFRSIFKSAFLPHRSPEVLDLFLKEIKYFDYSNSEELGNAYEYLLSIMSSQGDAGQFRTPRHIIDFIVEVTNPSKDDRILDPACGTAGFLISSYKHILKQHDGIDDPEKKEKPLTPQEKQKLMQNFHGYDIDPTMERIAAVNMYLHQFKNPKIFQYDALSSDEKWSEKFDVILANPPFMSPKGGIKPHSKFSIPSNRSEVLFVDYIMNHLRPEGRAGIIVPEGIIFQSGNTYKTLRKNLIDGGLYAVVSLPSGVFQPYSGVKTSVLLLNKKLAKQSNELLFIKIENDGFDLGAQRRSSAKNDLPQALEILQKWQIGEKLENKLASFVEKEKIAENGEYNLSGDRYRITTDYSKAKWPMVELGEVCEVYQPKTITSKEIKDNGKYKVFGANGVIGYFDEYNHENSEVAITCRGATCGTINYTEPKSWITGNAMVVRPKNSSLKKEYLNFLLRETDLTPVISGAAQPQITATSLRPFKIPLPPLEVQEQIVRELNGYQSIIQGAKQITQNWKPKITSDPSWEVKSLKEIVKDFQYGSSKKSASSGKVVCLRMGNIQNGEIDWNDLKFAPSDEDLEKYLLKPNDVLFNRTNSSVHVGKTGIYRGGREAVFAGYLIRLIYKKEMILGEYLNYCLNTSDAKDFFLKVKTDGINQSNINPKSLSALRISLPPLEVQKKIVSQIEAERALVESAKKLIEIYEQKTKATINKLWEE